MIDSGAGFAPGEADVGCSKKMRILLLLLTAMTLMMVSGCASISEHEDMIGHRPVIYPGVRGYVRATKEILGYDEPAYNADLGIGTERMCVICLLPWFLVDGLVLTPVMDTLLLPVDVVWIITYKEPKESIQPPPAPRTRSPERRREP